jgi:hypothetical protein
MMRLRARKDEATRMKPKKQKRAKVSAIGIVDGGSAGLGESTLTICLPTDDVGKFPLGRVVVLTLK